MFANDKASPRRAACPNMFGASTSSARRAPNPSSGRPAESSLGSTVLKSRLNRSTACSRPCGSMAKSMSIQSATLAHSMAHCSYSNGASAAPFGKTRCRESVSATVDPDRPRLDCRRSQIDPTRPYNAVLPTGRSRHQAAVLSFLNAEIVGSARPWRSMPFSPQQSTWLQPCTPVELYLVHRLRSVAEPCHIINPPSTAQP
jgi:hypothetical protein